MATITTDTFLDAAARTAGEAWTINGAVLTIRTDTRWHANAPATMTGTLGTVTLSATLGGGYFIDGTKVRWVPYTGGAGTVPAIGQTVTQFVSPGVSGYLLGVYADLVSAPVAVGAAMPATGFLKFREITGGQFQAGGFQESGLGATATEPDMPGWIEVVHDSTATINASPIGLGVKTRGDWFSLGTTSGVAGQTFQIPTNGGGAATVVQAIQVETAPGSNEYDWYPCTSTTSGWTTANIGTDIRSKIAFNSTSGNGVVILGSNGTTVTGYVPPAGCKVRVPNIFLRQAATTARAVNVLANATITSRPKFAGTSADLDVSNVMSDWHMGPSLFANVSIKNSAVEAYLAIVQPLKTCLLDNVTIGINGGSVSGQGLTIDSAVFGVSMLNCKTIQRVAVNDSKDVVMKNCLIAFPAAHAGANSGVGNLTQCDGIVIDRFSIIGGGFTLTNCSNIMATNIDYCDLMAGVTPTQFPTGGILYLTNCSDGVFSNFTIGFNNLFPQLHPYGALFNTQKCTRIKIRNAGTYANPLDTGPTNFPRYIHSFQAANEDVRLQRIYVKSLGQGVFNPSATTGTVSALANANIVYEQVGAVSNPGAITFANANSDSRAKGVGAAVTTGSGFGTFFMDGFTGVNTGRLAFSFPQKSAASEAFVSVSMSNPQSGFVAGGISLKSVGESILLETPYVVKGYTSFANIAPTLAGTLATNNDFSYQIDTGSGYGGWKALTAANLSAEAITYNGGFKMKLLVAVKTANATNTMNSVFISMATDEIAQSANLYPLDVVTLTFEGLKPGSEVRAYVGTNPATAVEIGGTESSGETFSITHSSSGQEGYIAIFAMGYQPLIIPRTYAYADSSLLIQQVIDRNYINP